MQPGLNTLYAAGDGDVSAGAQLLQAVVWRLADDVQPAVGTVLLHERQYLRAEPQHGVYIGPVVHLARERQRRHGIHRLLWHCIVIRYEYAIGNHSHLSLWRQRPQRRCVFCRHGQRARHLLTDAALETGDAPRLQPGPGRSRPARWLLPIDRENILLQLVFGVGRIVAAGHSRLLAAHQRQQTAHFQALKLNQIEALLLQQFIQTRAHAGAVQSTRQIRRARSNYIA